MSDEIIDGVRAAFKALKTSSEHAPPLELVDVGRRDGQLIGTFRLVVLNGGQLVDVKEQEVALGLPSSEELALLVEGARRRLEVCDDLECYMPLDLLSPWFDYHRVRGWTDADSDEHWTEEIKQTVALAADEAGFAGRWAVLESWPRAARVLYALWEIEAQVGGSGVTTYVQRNEETAHVLLEAASEAGCARIAARFRDELECVGAGEDPAGDYALVRAEVQPALQAWEQAHRDALVRSLLAGFAKAHPFIESLADAAQGRLGAVPPSLDALAAKLDVSGAAMLKVVTHWARRVAELRCGGMATQDIAPRALLEALTSRHVPRWSVGARLCHHANKVAFELESGGKDPWSVRMAARHARRAAQLIATWPSESVVRALIDEAAATLDSVG